MEEHNITAKIKDQQRCGCCWSHAATSALAYRYKLKGLDLDLSPQDGLSCYLPDCEIGNYLITPQLNLIKNGTVTEGCFPFVSGDGIYIPECPTTCKDGTEFKKYHSQNAYMTDYNSIHNNYYDIITLIIDILINEGPIVAGISVYKDFDILCQNKQQCHNTVYSYNGNSPYLGGLAVVVVGYGFMNNKFYWLIQNSWGPNACDDGFVKIEFGQIGIENIAFSEPYLEEEVETKVEIPVILGEVNDICDLIIKVEDNKYLNDWNNSLEINFQLENSKKKFSYQCGVLSSNIKEKEINCFYDYDNFYLPAGTYEFVSSQSLGKNNDFFINNSVIESFNFNGYESLFALFEEEQYFFVSEEGSKIIFVYDPEYAIGEDLPSIYPYGEEETPLSNCKRIILPAENGIYYLALCEFKENEINYFNEANYILFDILCEEQDYSYTIAEKLDKNKYPVYKINRVYIEKSDEISIETKIKLNAIIEGKISDKVLDQMFVVFNSIEYNNINISYYMTCKPGVPKDNSKIYNISCSMSMNRWNRIKYDKFYVLPYYVPYMIDYPYEVILKETIKAEKYDKSDDIVNYSSNIKLSLIIIFALAFML